MDVIYIKFTQQISNSIYSFVECHWSVQRETVAAADDDAVLLVPHPSVTRYVGNV